MIRRAVIVAGVMAGLLMAMAARAEAHVLGPQFISLLDGVTPRFPIKVQLTPTQSAPILSTAVLGTGTLTIIGEQQEPFVRITPDGAFVNRRSPTLYAIGNPNKNPPRSVGADLKPSWSKVSDKPHYQYPERRAEWPHTGPPQDVLRIGRRTTLINWAIPATYDGTPLEIEGHVDWIPRPLDLEIPMVLLAVLGWFVWRLISARTGQVDPLVRGIVLATLAGLVVEGALVAGEILRRGDAGMGRFAPLLAFPALLLVGSRVRSVWRSEQAGVVVSTVFAAYLLTLSIVRFGVGTGTSFALRLGLATEMLLGVGLATVGFIYLRRLSH
jgi:hypothetical protein